MALARKFTLYFRVGCEKTGSADVCKRYCAVLVTFMGNIQGVAGSVNQA